MKKHQATALIIMALLAGCQPVKEFRTTGSIDRLDPALDEIIGKDAKVEIIATGFDWSEGPVWVPSQNALLFSDVPKNTIYKWTEDKGHSVYLTPSGYTGSVPRGGEPGSNGLLIDNNGKLFLAQHGDRKIASMESPLSDPKPIFKTVADHYNGKRFDSPNDLTLDKKGNFYFTDPFYGLVNHEKDPHKNATYQGVYKVSPDGKVTLLTDTLTAPNGIALSPDQKYLFVANSDGRKARYYQYELGDAGFVSGKVFYDAATIRKEGMHGGPDGMKVDQRGRIFATGPGGILIMSAEGKLLGRINLPQAAANVALDDDEKTLYITSDSVVLRVKMR